MSGRASPDSDCEYCGEVINPQKTVHETGVRTNTPLPNGDTSFQQVPKPVPTQTTPVAGPSTADDNCIRDNAKNIKLESDKDLTDSTSAQQFSAEILPFWTVVVKFNGKGDWADFQRAQLDLFKSRTPIRFNTKIVYQYNVDPYSWESFVRFSGVGTKRKYFEGKLKLFFGQSLTVTTSEDIPCSFEDKDGSWGMIVMYLGQGNMEVFKEAVRKTAREAKVLYKFDDRQWSQCYRTPSFSNKPNDNTTNQTASSTTSQAPVHRPPSTASSTINQQTVQQPPPTAPSTTNHPPVQTRSAAVHSQSYRSVGGQSSSIPGQSSGISGETSLASGSGITNPIRIRPVPSTSYYSQRRNKKKLSPKCRVVLDEYLNNRTGKGNNDARHRNISRYLAKKDLQTRDDVLTFLRDLQDANKFVKDIIENPNINHDTAAMIFSHIREFVEYIETRAHQSIKENLKQAVSYWKSQTMLQRRNTRSHK